MIRFLLRKSLLFMGFSACWMGATGADEPVAIPKAVAEVPLTPWNEPSGSWTLVVLPDTQFYSQSKPAIFDRQTAWITRNREANNILFVLHVGDIVNSPQARYQWERAKKSMGILSDAGIPCALASGNHDIGTQPYGAPNSRETLLNEFFEPVRSGEAGGCFEEGKLENTWRTLDAPTGNFLVLTLEFGPRDEVLAWADDVMRKHADRTVIVLTHDHLRPDTQTRANASSDRDKPLRTNPKSYPFAAIGSANDGEDVWRKLISRHANIRFVFSGHRTGSGYLASRGKGGQTVHQISSCYQGWAEGGGGYLRLLQFHPDGQTVKVRTYSPWYDQWKSAPPEAFSLRIDD
jgi:3',5'-cyclic AMP phosphodiesterase CpdA